MKGLLYKELCVTKLAFRMVGIMVALFAAASLMQKNATFFFSAMSMILIIMPINTFSYDKMSGWDSFAAATPVGRRKMVGAKYIMSVLFCGVLVVMAGILTIAQKILYKTNGFVENFSATGVMILIGLLILSIMMPLIYKFGVEKSRIMLFALALIPTVLVSLLPQLGITLPEELSAPSPAMIAVIAAAILGLFALSYVVSLKIMEAKEL